MKVTNLYAFVFRGVLASEAMNRGGWSRAAAPALDTEVAKRLPINSLDAEHVAMARRMATVYTAVAAFENSARAFVSKRLLEDIGVDWWERTVPEGIRTRANARREAEEKIRWHKPRGDQPLNYTELGDLASIVGNNTTWPLFENHIQSLDWAKQIFRTLELSRNVIMHSGELGNEDVERVGAAIRDWLRQVGT